MNQHQLVQKATAVADILLAGVATLAMAVFLYIVYYYFWTAQRQISSWEGILTYYITPGLLAAALFACLRLPPSQRINIVLAFYSATTVIYLFEAGVTVWLNMPSVINAHNRSVRARAAAAYGVKFDARSKREVVNDLRSRGIDAVPTVYPKVLLQRISQDTARSLVTIGGQEALPPGSISRRTTIVCNETGEFVTYVSDEHGFNNPKGLWDKGPMDIVTLGDSYTQGFCVQPEKHFVTAIRKRYPKTLNLGIEGNGPLLMLAAIKEYAQALRPKLVLWFYYEGNDLTDLQLEKDSQLLRSYLTPGFRQGLLQRQAEIDQALSDYIEPLLRQGTLSRSLEEISSVVRDFNRNTLENIFKLWSIRTRLGMIQGRLSRPLVRTELSMRNNDQEALRLLDLINHTLRDIVFEANRSIEECGGRLYFVYLPASTNYTLTETPPSGHHEVLKIVASLGIPIIDIRQIFDAHKDPLALFPFRVDGHYNEEGDSVVAQEVLSVISNEF